MIRRLPFIVTAIMAIWILGNFRVPATKSDAFAVNQWGRLPVVSSGRFQPLDSLARNSLLQLRHKQELNAEPWKDNSDHPKMMTATEWLMEMTMNPAVADTLPVFRIDHPDLKGLLALPMDPDKAAQTDGKHYSWKQITPKLKELQEQSAKAFPKEDANRTTFEKAVVKLSNKVGQYMRLQNTLQPQNAQDWASELSHYLASIEPGRAAAMAQNSGKQYDQKALDELMRDLQRFDAMRQLEPALVVPPADAAPVTESWLRMGEALMNLARGETPNAAVLGYAKMASAFKAGNPAAFNDAVRDYRIALGGKWDKQVGKAKSEQLLNFFQPFYDGMVIFVLAALLTIAFWVRPEQWEVLRRTAVWLCVLGLMVHSTGLVWRMVLEGRPPVTNLYSSAIFIGWGAAVLGLILEAFWKNGIGTVIASVCAFCSLQIAHYLSLTGDTMEMMRAVLDTNFWLATHVVVVTLGYAATFVAGFLAVIFILRGFFTTGIDAATGKSLNKMIYGILCFATLFSFVGTVLGGIWADQSWGRFWGWDVKENGALMIVLWNALVLHARWGGLVRERGIASMAIFGNIVTAWSWFGVNMLGVGLHSYGFMDAAFYWLMGFIASQLILMAIAALPLEMWKSFKGRTGSGGKPATPPSGGAAQPA